jgi:hypothetical protein
MRLLPRRLRKRRDPFGRLLAELAPPAPRRTRARLRKHRNRSANTRGRKPIAAGDVAEALLQLLIEWPP